MTETFNKGDRVSVMATVIEPKGYLTKIEVDGTNEEYQFSIKSDRLTLFERAKPERPPQPPVGAVVKYTLFQEEKTYLRLREGWMAISAGGRVFSGIGCYRSYEQMFEWENISFLPAIEKYWEDTHTKRVSLKRAKLRDAYSG